MLLFWSYTFNYILVLISPVCRLRLVMPPTLFFTLSFPMTRLAYLIFPVNMANGIIAGAFTFCEYGRLSTPLLPNLYF
jgi:hypothetical protein